MAICGKYFEYNGKSSEELGLAIGFLNMKDEIPMGLARTVERGEVNQYRYRANHFGTTYDDVLVFELGLVKDNCDPDVDDIRFSRSEVREINAWLTSPKLPKLFHMTDYDDDDIDLELYDEYVDYFCTMTNVTASGNDEVTVLTYEVTCDSPFGYSQEIKRNIHATYAIPGTATIINNSDELEDYIYPIMKIIPQSTGEIIIENITDGRSMTIDVLASDIIYMDCQKLTIYDETKNLITFDDLGITDVDDIYWFRLCSGKNNIKITGNVDVEIKYREPRKVGAY